MMRKLLLILIALLVVADIYGQQIVSNKTLFAVDKLPDSALREVNALTFIPPAYKKIIRPNNLQRHDGKSGQTRLEQFCSYNKNDVYISINSSFITLSSFYRYSNKDISPEDELKMYNSGFVTFPQFLGRNNSYTLLENVNADYLTLINADSVFIYNSNQKFKVNSATENYGSIVVNLIKFDLGRVHLVYYYPLDKYKEVLKEINNTWGVVRFKPDDEFSPVNYSESVPKPKYPYELYFGKFSHLNNIEQQREEEEERKKRMAKFAFSKRIFDAGVIARKGDLKTAKSLYATLLNEDPTNPMLYNQLVLIAMDENNQDSTWYYWHKLHDVSPHAIQTWVLKGGIEKRFNDFDAAKITFEKLLLTSDTINPFLHMDLASVYGSLGLNDKASKTYDRLLNIFSVERAKGLKGENHRMLNFGQLMEARMNYALLLNSMHKYDKSIELLEATVDDNNQLVEASKSRKQIGIYGALNDSQLSNVYMLLGLTYGMAKMETNAKVNLQEAKRLGKTIPAELEDFLNSTDN